MKVNTNPYKGTRDFYPEDKRFQQWMFDKWKRVAERYGYLEYDAPILEPTELFLMKGSDEIVQDQTYTFKDRGDRSVTIRTEMTPSVSRMIAGKRQEISYPARWYSIPNLWRYERTQRGRLREFWQLNVDIFGVESIDAEIEIIQIIDDLFQAFKAKRSTYVIKLNSRKLVNSILKDIGLVSNKSQEIIRLIDKIGKISTEEFAKKLDEITSSQETSKKLVKLLSITSPEHLPEKYLKDKSVINLIKILKTSNSIGIRNIEFDISLMRGFDYYNDVVFEVFDKNPENNRSMFGGGRYDGLIGQFGVEPIATVGFGMGDVTFKDFLEVHKLIPKLTLPTTVTVLINSENELNTAKYVAHELREIGVNTSIDLTQRKLDKQLRSADKNGVRFVIIVGEQEKLEELYTLKDMKTGKEEKHSIQRIASIVKDSRIK